MYPFDFIVGYLNISKPNIGPFIYIHQTRLLLQTLLRLETGNLIGSSKPNSQLWGDFRVRVSDWVIE